MIRKILRYTGIVLLVLLVLAVARTWYVIDAMRPAHKPSFLAQVTVDIEVDGEPVFIERVIECRTFEVPAGELLQRIGKPAPTRYFPVVRGMGARLKSGGAIMMYTPYLCDHEVIEDGGESKIKVTPNPPGALTMMAWTEDADDPEVLEIYASQAYFRRPEARVKINRVEATDPPPGASADPPGKFSWFAPKRVYYTRPEQLGVAKTLSDRAKRSPKHKYNAGRGYQSVAAAPIPRDIWIQDEALGNALENVQTPTILEGEVLVKASRFFDRKYNKRLRVLGYDGEMGWVPDIGPNQSLPAEKIRRPYEFLTDVLPAQVDKVGVKITIRDTGPYILSIVGAFPVPDYHKVSVHYRNENAGQISLSGPLTKFMFDPSADLLWAIRITNFLFEGEPVRRP